MAEWRDRQLTVSGDVHVLLGCAGAGVERQLGAHGAAVRGVAGAVVPELQGPVRDRGHRGGQHRLHNRALRSDGGSGGSPHRAAQLAGSGLGHGAVGVLHQRHVLEPQLLGQREHTGWGSGTPAPHVPTCPLHCGDAGGCHVCRTSAGGTRCDHPGIGLGTGVLHAGGPDSGRRVARVVDGVRRRHQPDRPIRGGDVQRQLPAAGNGGAGIPARYPGAALPPRHPHPGHHPVLRRRAGPR
mmetsp:Transcript_4868/g.13998  ORF Transcript_4868/g.13998 Transcript_4868/m.13998 type:complete len:240 (+) Transcript_4868:662-1381(+)